MPMYSNQIIPQNLQDPAQSFILKAPVEIPEVPSTKIKLTSPLIKNKGKIYKA